MLGVVHRDIIYDTCLWAGPLCLLHEPLSGLGLHISKACVQGTSLTCRLYLPLRPWSHIPQCTSVARVLEASGGPCCRGLQGLFGCLFCQWWTVCMWPPLGLWYKLGTKLGLCFLSTAVPWSIWMDCVHLINRPAEKKPICSLSTEVFKSTM